MDEKEELIAAIRELKKEVEELKQVVSALVEMVVEAGFDEEDVPLDRDEIKKLLPDHQNIYN